MRVSVKLYRRKTSKHTEIYIMVSQCPEIDVRCEFRGFWRNISAFLLFPNQDVAYSIVD